jgi:hypothetical protein
LTLGASELTSLICYPPLSRYPPVAIDNARVLDKVWPAFCNSIPSAQRPKDWKGTTLAAYYRYMTAILAWSEARNWTTTQMESTIFCEYMS